MGRWLQDEARRTGLGWIVEGMFDAWARIWGLPARPPQKELSR